MDNYEHPVMYGPFHCCCEFAVFNKIFQDKLFQEKNTNKINWNRFETVLRFYGDPEEIHEKEQKNVYQKYEWNRELIKKIKTVANKS